ncbi:DNA-directed RNA polymerase subunit L [Candidatus Woesearchaeota archaeon]|nr:DNA-directed RNA polymerase subunit L [Candidatus Woesearchaeota archaeon]
MELSIVEETPKKLVFEVKGQGHTLCNILKSKLWANKHVKIATYNIAHPLVGVPRMTIETDGEAKPRKVVTDAAESLRKDVAELKQELKKFRW